MFEQLILKALLDGQNRPPEYASKTEAETALKAFLDIKTVEIEKGDAIERNEFGRRAYQVPAENQAAICVEKLTPYVDDNGNLCDMRIAIALAKDVFRYFDVDSRCFRVVGSNRVNVYDFQKKRP